MANYEIMFIVNPNATEDEVDKIVTQVEGVITSAGGQILKKEKMGKRRLAYEVSRFREGFYVLFALTANGDVVRECERRLRVMDPVLKYLTVRVDDETRRLDKMRSYRQRRAARRSSGSSAVATAEQTAEEEF
jgi:small subunit ribosomal protein S6